MNLGDMWGGWSTPRLSRLAPGIGKLHLVYRRLAGPQGWSGQVRVNFPPPVFEPRNFQPLARLYTG